MRPRSVLHQDGHFVPNLTLGPPIVKSLRKHTSAFLDCHLMVSEPAKWVADFAAAGADQFTFHLEAALPAGTTPGAARLSLSSPPSLERYETSGYGILGEMVTFKDVSYGEIRDLGRWESSG